MSCQPHDPLLTFLRRLSRRGAIARQISTNDTTSTWATLLVRDGAVAKMEPTDSIVVEHARSRGFIAPAEDGTWRLSRRGIAKLRGARHIADGPDQSGTAAALKSPTDVKEKSDIPRQSSKRSGKRDPIRPSFATPAEGSLEWLRCRRDATGQPLISDIEYQAGLRLAQDFEIALMQPRITASWSGINHAGGRRRPSQRTSLDISERAIAARARVEAAVAETGPDFSGFLLDICCFHIPLSVVERNGRLPQRSAKILLQFALRALARHYRMLPYESHESLRRLRHWGSDDYRPTAGMA